MRQGAVGQPRAVDMAAKADVVNDFGSGELPRIAKGQPILGIFVLPAVLDGLSEQAVVITYSIADRGDIERRHAVHETGGEAPEAPIAERRVGLQRPQRVEIDAKIGEGRAHRLRQTQIGERVDQQPPDQKLEREIINPPPVLLIVALRRREPGRHDAVAGRQRGGDEPVARARGGFVLADRGGETAQHLVAQGARLRIETGGGGGRRNGEVDNAHGGLSRNGLGVSRGFDAARAAFLEGRRLHALIFTAGRLAHSREGFTPRRRDAIMALFQDELDAAAFPAPLLVVGCDRLLVPMADACQTRGGDALVDEIPH